MNDVIDAGTALPKPVGFRYGKSAQYKLMKIAESPFPDQMIDTPELAEKFWRANIATQQWYNTEAECFCVLFLNTRRYVTGWNLVSIGTLDTILVHPREVFRTAIICGASAIIIAHNHPSGDPQPSEADVKVTRDLIRAGQIIKIEVVDHVVIGSPSPARPLGYVSLRELGYFFS